MSEDLKTIKEIADEIGVSKQAVWQKIKKESSIDLRQFTSKKGNTVYVDVDGQKAIKSAFFNKTSTTKRQQKVFVDDNVNNSVDGNPEGNEEILFLRNLTQEKHPAIQKLGCFFMRCSQPCNVSEKDNYFSLSSKCFSIHYRFLLKIDFKPRISLCMEF